MLGPYGVIRSQNHIFSMKKKKKILSSLSVQPATQLWYSQSYSYCNHLQSISYFSKKIEYSGQQHIFGCHKHGIQQMKVIVVVYS